MNVLDFVHLMICLGIGGLFFSSGISKFLRMYSFRRTLRLYRLLPEWSIGLMVLFLPTIEIIAGALLAASIWAAVYVQAWLAAVGLLLAFTGAIVITLFRGIEVPCGCGLLLGSHVLTHMTLGRNLMLLTLLVFDAAYLA
jgi:hypothetical protein